ncbi:MAG: alpha/beta hydrolase family protein [bacterium]
MKKDKNQSEKTYQVRSFLIYIVLFIIAFLAGAFIQKRISIISKICYMILPAKKLRRNELYELFNLDPIREWEVAQNMREETLPGYRRRLINFRTGTDTTEAYLLIPGESGSGPYPAILCIHGHHSDKEEVVGITKSRNNAQFGLTLVKNGYCVLAPDIVESQDFNREDFLALALIARGASLTSRRLSDLWRCVNYLKNNNKLVDKERIGVVGWSMGGGLSLYLSALNTDIRVVYVSCYFNQFAHSILSRRQTTDNYVPGLIQFGDMSDIAALIAPRPLFLEQADRDPEFPLEYARIAFRELQKIYQQERATENLAMAVGEGKHVFFGKELIPWFKKYL